jgi:nucleoside-diphosphate-sugar epimerase
MAGRILVTGATGFVGSHTIGPLRKRGFEVCAIGRARPPDPAISWRQVDLLDNQATAEAVAELRAEYLLHAAWLNGPERVWTAPGNLYWVGASLSLLKAFAAGGGRRAVMVGSCAEYRWIETPLDEFDAECAPTTLYGTAKDATRRVAEAFAAQTGLSLAWARPFFVYGPGQPKISLVASAIDALANGRRFSASEGLQQRDYLHVTDVAAALAALLDAAVMGPVNIASGQAVAVRDILGAVAGLLGRSHLLALGEIAMAPHEPFRIEAVVTRLTEEVGFSPKFNLSSGLRDTILAERRKGSQTKSSSLQ